jgi:hypothetical protein
MNVDPTEVVFCRGTSCGKTELTAFYCSACGTPLDLIGAGGIHACVSARGAAIVENTNLTERTPRVKRDSRPRDGRYGPRWGFKV